MIWPFDSKGTASLNNARSGGLYGADGAEADRFQAFISAAKTRTSSRGPVTIRPRLSFEFVMCMWACSLPAATP